MEPSNHDKNPKKFNEQKIGIELTVRGGSAWKISLNSALKASYNKASQYDSQINQHVEYCGFYDHSLDELKRLTWEMMKESGFIIPHDIPSHNWLKRGLDAAPNCEIKPGRYWGPLKRGKINDHAYFSFLFNFIDEQRCTLSINSKLSSSSWIDLGLIECLLLDRPPALGCNNSRCFRRVTLAGRKGLIRLIGRPRGYDDVSKAPLIQMINGDVNLRTAIRVPLSAPSVYANDE
ncbi:hypothetical protein LguiB_005591 [Lonicera macranthoides]